MPRPLIPDRRNVVLDAAAELILASGFDRVTVEQVARRAGIAKGAVYREFASKHEMIDALLTRATRRLVAQVRERVTTANSPVGLSGSYRFALEALLDDPLMTAAFLDDEAVLGSHIRAVGPGRYRARFGWGAEYLRELCARGSVRIAAEPDAIALALSAFTIGTLSLGSTVGPLDRSQLAAAVEVVIELVRHAEGPVDSESSNALLALLDRLDHQLADLEAGASSDHAGADRDRGGAVSSRAGADSDQLERP